jgi:SAM-dependent methyltransferase
MACDNRGSPLDTDVQPEIDRLHWLRRWDAQQEGYVPEREARFTAMFDALAELLPASFVALDLACGPGSISRRLLARFPEARAIAVDIDPVMLAIGRGALGTVDGRLRWIGTDLASPGWLEALGETRVDAVLSSTALHWLEPAPLARLYHDLGRLLRPGGLVLNGDNLAFGPASPTVARLSERAQTDFGPIERNRLASRKGCGSPDRARRIALALGTEGPARCQTSHRRIRTI